MWLQLPHSVQRLQSSDPDDGAARQVCGSTADCGTCRVTAYPEFVLSATWTRLIAPDGWTRLS